jgi:hypothetical protein
MSLVTIQLLISLDFTLRDRRLTDRLLIVFRQWNVASGITSSL